MHAEIPAHLHVQCPLLLLHFNHWTQFQSTTQH